VQLGLRVAELCGVVARVRVVARRDGGPGRCCWGSLCDECIELLCRVDDEVVSMLVVGVVWRGSSGGLVSSSLSERPVFAPPIALTASSLRLW
jgi:hypothetical protein